MNTVKIQVSNYKCIIQLDGHQESSRLDRVNTKPFRSEPTHCLPYKVQKLISPRYVALNRPCKKYSISTGLNHFAVKYVFSTNFAWERILFSTKVNELCIRSLDYSNNVTETKLFSSIKISSRKHFQSGVVYSVRDTVDLLNVRIAFATMQKLPASTLQGSDHRLRSIKAKNAMWNCLSHMLRWYSLTTNPYKAVRVKLYTSVSVECTIGQYTHFEHIGSLRK